MSTFEYLSKKVLDWADKKGILQEDPAQAVNQIKKMKEEVDEFEKELLGVRDTRENFEVNDWHYYQSEMELGDVMVTVIITAACAGLDPIKSLDKALQKISKRSGKVVNGIFVKD